MLFLLTLVVVWLCSGGVEANEAPMRHFMHAMRRHKPAEARRHLLAMEHELALVRFAQLGVAVTTRLLQDVRAAQQGDEHAFQRLDTLVPQYRAQVASIKAAFMNGREMFVTAHMTALYYLREDVRRSRRLTDGEKDALMATISGVTVKTTAAEFDALRARLRQL